MTDAANNRPDWETLLATAAEQEGLFSTVQAAEAGFSPQLLAHHRQAGRIARVRRGIYRVRHLPHGEHEHLLIAWLWSEQRGVVSHESALALHRLSDVLPAVLHMTVPAAWRARRLRVPAGLLLHHREVPDHDRRWHGPVPVTGVARTLADCAREHFDPELLHQAMTEALERGLVFAEDVSEVREALRRYGIAEDGEP